MRHLRRGRGHLHQIQRHAPLRQALHALCRQKGEERDQEADPRLLGRQDSRGRLRRQRQHAGSVDGIVRFRPQEWDRSSCDNNRRGDRGIPSAERGHSPQVLRIQRDSFPSQVFHGVGGDHGRDRAAVRREQSMHLLRGVQAPSDERRSAEDRREIPGYRP